MEVIGLWAEDLTSKSEVELEPLFAQVGARRQRFRELFVRESCLHRSTVSQDVDAIHKHTCSRRSLVPPGPARCLSHAQQHTDDFQFLFFDGKRNGHVWSGLSQAQLSGMIDRKQGNPFCRHTKTRGRRHTGRKRKLEISDGKVKRHTVQRDRLKRTCETFHPHV